MHVSCGCPHAPYSHQAHHEAHARFGRRSFLAGLGAGALALAAGRPAAAADEGKTIVLRAARMFDGATVHTPGVLVVRGERVVSFNAGDAGSDAVVVDLGDATIVPGLIDCHTHVVPTLVVSSYSLEDYQPGMGADSIGGAAYSAAVNARKMLRNGFTTLRDCGGGAGVDLALRDAIRAKQVIGPRLHVSGVYLGVNGGGVDTNEVPDYLPHLDPSFQGSVGTGADTFRRFVRQHASRHVDQIKIIATGAVMSYGDTWDIAQFDSDEVAAVVSEATKFGLHVAAHAHGEHGISTAVMGGVHSIEHGTDVSSATAAAMRDRDIVLVPTIWALDSILQPGNPGHLAQEWITKAHHAAGVRDAGLLRARAAGVRFAYGSDAGVFPHDENNRDFSRLAARGLTPIEVIKTATVNAARLLGATDRGHLRPGALADIAVFSGDATMDAARLETPPVMVMLGGERLDSKLLAA